MSRTWADDFNTYEEACAYYGCDSPRTLAAEQRAMEEEDRRHRASRSAGCSCSERQLALVGCDCGAELDPPDPRAPERIAPIAVAAPSEPVAEGWSIVVRYRAIDGYGDRRTFKTIDGARRYAHKVVGATPEIGTGYAVSGDGVGKVTVSGCTLREIFPDSF